MRGICDIRSRLIASAPIASDGEELDEFHRIATPGNRLLTAHADRRCAGYLAPVLDTQDDLTGETFRPPLESYLAVQRYDHPLHDLHPEAPARGFGDGWSPNFRPLEHQPSVGGDRPVDVH